MNLRNILNAHRDAVTHQEQAVQQLQEKCRDIDEVISYVVKPAFEEAERQIREAGFDVGMETETRVLESHRTQFRFTASCVLTAGKSIPASTLTLDGNPRAGTIDYLKVVGGLRHEETLPVNQVTEHMVLQEVERFVMEVFPSDLW